MNSEEIEYTLETPIWMMNYQMVLLVKKRNMKFSELDQFMTPIFLKKQMRMTRYAAARTVGIKSSHILFIYYEDNY